MPTKAWDDTTEGQHSVALYENPNMFKGKIYIKDRNHAISRESRQET